MQYNNWFLRLGFCGGGFITVDISRNAAFQAEALVTTKGSKGLGGFGEYPSHRYSLIARYLEIPLLIRLASTPTRRESRFFLLAGPAVGIKYSGYLYRDSEKIPFNGLKSTDLGLVLGIGLVRNARYVFELRYTSGFAKIIEQDGVPLDIKNSALSVMAGYVF
jgi:hypothetical protein